MATFSIAFVRPAVYAIYEPCTCFLSLDSGNPLSVGWGVDALSTGDEPDDDAGDDDGEGVVVPDVEADPYGSEAIFDAFRQLRIGARRVECDLGDLKPGRFVIFRAGDSDPLCEFEVDGRRCWLGRVRQLLNKTKTLQNPKP